MADNESSGMLVNIVVAAVFGGIGYFLRGYTDQFHKKRNARFEGQRRAADKILPVLAEYVRLSERLCEEIVSSSGRTPDDCIHAYKENVKNLFRLCDELNKEVDQSMHYFDKSTEKKAKIMISLLSIKMQKLAKNFENAEDFREDGEEVLRIMKRGVSDYCDKYTREISSAISAVKDGVRKDLV